MVDLFVRLFGEDYLSYIYTPEHGSQIVDTSDPRKSFEYDHEQWEASFQTACQERSENLKPANTSAYLLKQLASQPQAQWTDPEPMHDDVADEHDVVEDASISVASPVLATEILSQSNSSDVEMVATENNCSPYTLPETCRKEVTHVSNDVRHGLPISISALFQKSASCVIPSTESSLVDGLVDGLVTFKGSSVIDARDLVALKGCQSKSEDNHLTNFSIEGYLDLISKQSVLQGMRVEWIGWEVFEKAVGQQPANIVLKRKAPLLKQDIVLVPCNPGQSKHWFLLVLQPQKCQILVLDSLAGRYIKPTAKNAISKMLLLLKELDTNIDVSKWKFFTNTHTDIPQQQNDYDCGVFACMYARCLVLQHPMTGHIPNFRKMMILELHQQQPLLNFH